MGRRREAKRCQVVMGEQNGTGSGPSVMIWLEEHEDECQGLTAMVSRYRVTDAPPAPASSYLHTRLVVLYIYSILLAKPALESVGTQARTGSPLELAF